MWIVVLCVALTVVLAVTSYSAPPASFELAYGVNSTGGVTAGSVEQLHALLSDGAYLNIYVPEHSILIQADILAPLSSQLVCGKSRPLPTHSAWSTLNSAATWTFRMVCTVGTMDSLTLSVGGNSTMSSSLVDVSSWWYVRPYNSSGRIPLEAMPYTNYSSLVLGGHEVRCETGSSFRMDVVHVMTTDVVGHQAISLSAMGDGGRGGKKFNTGSMFYYIAFFNLTNLYKFTWYADTANVYPNAQPSTPARTCYADQAWLQVLQVSANGSVLAGSAEAVREAVNGGHRLRLVLDQGSGSVAFEPETILVDDSGIVVQKVRTIKARASDPRYPDEAGQWHMYLASTAGVTGVQQCHMGTTSCSLHATSDSTTAHWYMDASATWLNVYATAADGSASSGSLADLRSSVLGGAAVRVGFGTAVVQYFTASQILLDDSSEHLSASYADMINLNDQLGFDASQAYWKHISVATDGNVAVNTWFMDGVDAVGAASQVMETYWFVSPLPDGTTEGHTTEFTTEATTPDLQEVTTEATTPELPEVTTEATTPELQEVTTEATTPELQEVTTEATTSELQELTTKATTSELQEVTTEATTSELQEVTTEATTPELQDVTTEAATPELPDVTAEATIPELPEVTSESTTPELLEVTPEATTPVLPEVTFEITAPDITNHLNSDATTVDVSTEITTDIINNNSTTLEFSEMTKNMSTDTTQDMQYTIYINPYYTMFNNMSTTDEDSTPANIIRSQSTHDVNTPPATTLKSPGGHDGPNSKYTSWDPFILQTVQIHLRSGGRVNASRANVTVRSLADRILILRSFDDTEKRRRYKQAVDAQYGDVIGSGMLFLVLAEIAFLLLLDLPTYRSHWRAPPKVTLRNIGAKKKVKKKKRPKQKTSGNCDELKDVGGDVEIVGLLSVSTQSCSEL